MLICDRCRGVDDVRTATFRIAVDARPREHPPQSDYGLSRSAELPMDKRGASS